MAEINNALAAQIRVPEIDTLGTLQKLTQFQLGKQALEHKQFLYDQGHGYDPNELSTLQDVYQKKSEIRGRAANEIYNDPSDAGVQRAFEHWDKAGAPLDDVTKARILKMSPAERKQTAAQIQQGAMPSQTAIEQTGIPAGNQTRETGKYLPEGIQPNTPYTSRTAAATGGAGRSKAVMDDDEAVRKGLYSPTPEQIKRGVAGPPSQTPNSTVANRFPNQSVFQPRIIRGPDGSISSSVTPETQGLQQSAVERFKQMQDTAGRGQGLMGQLDAIEHENDVLNSAGWSSTGAGANAKLSAAKSINSLFTSLGIAPPIDPEKVANWEGYNKQTVRAGFDLARTLGGHQAESVIQSSVSATPNVENTYFGSKVITNSIRQTVQREIDMYRYSLDYAKRAGSTFGAEDDFNKKFPPKLYSQTAVANAIPETSIKRLTASGGSQKDKAQFDSVYGTGMADFVLRNTH